MDRGIDKLLIEQGRRVILVFTDGVDMPLQFSNHNKSLKDVMKRAEEDDVMVYAIGLAGQNGMPDPGGRGTDRGRGGMNPGAFGGLGGRGLGGYTGGQLQTGAARRRAAEDRGGDRRRILRADVATGPGVDLRARRRTSCITSTRSASRPRSSTARCTTSRSTCRTRT